MYPFDQCSAQSEYTIHVRVTRENFASPLTKEQQQHPSETALDGMIPDFYIDNSGTLQDLTNTITKWIKGDLYESKTACEDSIIGMYRNKLKETVSDEQIRQMLKDETWLTAQEVTEYFDDIEIQGAMQIAACADEEYFARYRNTPERVLAWNRVLQPQKNEENDTEIEIEKMKLDLSLI